MARLVMSSLRTRAACTRLEIEVEANDYNPACKGGEYTAYGQAKLFRVDEYGVSKQRCLSYGRPGNPLADLNSMGTDSVLDIK